MSLVGCSLGGRVIYSCLESLAERKAFGLIDSVVVIRAPMPSDAQDWKMMRSVVMGRLVNIYSAEDYILDSSTRRAVLNLVSQVCRQ